MPLPVPSLVLLAMLTTPVKPVSAVTAIVMVFVALLHHVLQPAVVHLVLWAMPLIQVLVSNAQLITAPVASLLTLQPVLSAFQDFILLLHLKHAVHVCLHNCSTVNPLVNVWSAAQKSIAKHVELLLVSVPHARQDIHW